MNENVHTSNSKQYIFLQIAHTASIWMKKKATVEKRLLSWNLTVIELWLKKKKKKDCIKTSSFVCLSVRNIATNWRERERGRAEERSKKYVFRCTRMHSGCSRQCLWSVCCAQSNPFHFSIRCKAQRHRIYQNPNMRILMRAIPAYAKAIFRVTQATDKCDSITNTNQIYIKVYQNMDDVPIDGTEIDTMKGERRLGNSAVHWKHKKSICLCVQHAHQFTKNNFEYKKQTVETTAT